MKLLHRQAFSFGYTDQYSIVSYNTTNTHSTGFGVFCFRLIISFKSNTNQFLQKKIIIILRVQNLCVQSARARLQVHFLNNFQCETETEILKMRTHVTSLWHYHLNMMQYTYFMCIKWYIIHMTQI